MNENNNPIEKKEPDFSNFQPKLLPKDVEITVYCSRPDCPNVIKMLPKNYRGKTEEPYHQFCCSRCRQLGKVISEEQKQKISKKLTGRKLSEEHKKKMSDHMKYSEEGIARVKKNLIPGMGGSGWNKGKTTPDEVKAKQSAAHKGKTFTPEHCENISIGRKKMLAETGGFPIEHRQNMSKATIKQYKEKGFSPNTHHLKGWHFSPKLQEYVYYRSSYEKRAFMLLDEDPNVINYLTEEIEIDYMHPTKNIISQYLVDLLVTYKNCTKLIEIKPKKRTTEPVNMAKSEAGRKKASMMGCEYEIWSEPQLYGANWLEKDVRNFIKWLKQIIESEQ